MKIEYNFAYIQDLDFICKIDENCFSDRYGRDYFYDNILANKIIVAKCEERIVGFILFSIVLDESEILKIAVDEGFRGFSIGSGLMKIYIDYVNRDLRRELMLEVRESNFSAIKLYEKFGYEVVRTIKNYYSNPQEDGFFMLRGN